MDRKAFLSLSALAALSTGCGGRTAGTRAAEAVDSAGQRAYPPAVQQDPLGRRVIHDRQTFLEHHKYEHWQPGQPWNEGEAEAWEQLTGEWSSGSTPIRRNPMQVAAGLYLLGPEDNGQGIYLWDTGAGLLLIDPSYTRFQPQLEVQIRQLGYTPEQVRWVLLTHMHFDHVESAGAWEARGAEVHIHAADAPYVTGETAAEATEIDPPVKQPVTFEDGAELAFGGVTLSALHTPGHTPGSCCLFGSWQGQPLVVSGDIALHWGRHAWMGADYCDWDQYLASLWKLHRRAEEAGTQLMLPGHGTIELEGAGRSIWATVLLTSEIIRRRRAGETELEWLNPYEVFRARKDAGLPELEPLEA